MELQSRFLSLTLFFEPVSERPLLVSEHMFLAFTCAEHPYRFKNVHFKHVLGI